MEYIKKRGRPPKVNKKVPETLESTIKQNENDLKKYSLINNNIIGNIQSHINKNVIIHLKLNKEKINELEKIIAEKANPLDTLNSSGDGARSFDVGGPFDVAGPFDGAGPTTEKITIDNSYVKSTEYTDVIKIPIELQQPIENTKKSVVKPIESKNTKETIEKKKIEHRRNLIINYGIEYKIHKIMSDFKTWPSSSPYVCWYDCHHFPWAPVGIPEKIVYSDNSFVFSLYGNFCSFNCALTYLSPSNNIDDNACINTHMDKVVCDDKYDKIQLLEMLAHIELNTPINSKIKRAGPRLALNIFGGPLTIEEYRQNFNTLTEFHIYKYPIISINYNLEETTIKNAKKEVTNDVGNYNYYSDLIKLSGF